MNNRFFDLNKKTSITNDDPKQTKPFETKFLLNHYEKVKNLNQDLKRLPSEGEQFWLQSDTQFNAFTFIPFITQFEFIEHLYASTYSIAIRVVDSLIELHENGKIGEITLLISDSLRQRNPKTIDKIMAYENHYPNLHIKFAWNHSKVALAKTANGNYIIEGSGNWSENAHYEQYTFTNSKDAYDFRMKLFTETIER
ncbi:hypothetical protein [Faecalibacter sp. LW9]|uniref:hypothetical protein n=1 Tax=Faecalibacter sp. LW9 TaxID=3103144 RepID=UPI002AFEA365|nr:hypothetical protein [Faecalibacter sp. LW9]